MTHRYLGLAVGLLMLVWCLSGVVMLFVHWPSVTDEQRTAGLAGIDWRQCCDFGGELDPRLAVAGAEIEAVNGRPVLRLTLADGARGALDLSTGQGVPAFGPADATAVASGFVGGASPVVQVTAVERDQWTVTGYFNAARPFWRVSTADGRQVYVSWASGEVVQATTASGRFWNWLGAIPHWLYPQVLRQDVKLWTQVVVWTSLAGTFLTVAGLWLGIAAWRPWRDARTTPYRGLMAWHHLTGLAAGLLTLTWVASGLLSMNPWGLLESGPDPAVERLAGPPPAWGAVRPALEAVAQRAPLARQVRLAPFRGEVFVMADGMRLDAQGRPAPLTRQALEAAGRALGAVEAQGLIRRGDAYYYAHHEAVRLPAWRVVGADGRRRYLDPATGEVLASVDGAGRGYRWLHLGLHRLDIVPGLDRGPAWAAIVTALLAAVTAGVAIGVWLAWRRLRHDVGRLVGR